jgi:hypothetical protein
MAGQVTTGVLIYTYLRDGLDRGLKNRDPKYINWKQKCKILMDSVNDYAR